MAQGFRFLCHQSTDLLLARSPPFLAHRVEQFLSNDLVDTPGSDQSRRALVFFLLHAAALWGHNSSLRLLPISGLLAGANYPRRNARARFDDSSLVCFASLRSQQNFVQ